MARKRKTSSLPKSISLKALKTLAQEMQDIMELNPPFRYDSMTRAEILDEIVEHGKEVYTSDDFTKDSWKILHMLGIKGVDPDGGEDDDSGGDVESDQGSEPEEETPEVVGTEEDPEDQVEDPPEEEPDPEVEEGTDDPPEQEEEPEPDPDPVGEVPDKDLVEQLKNLSGDLSGAELSGGRLYVFNVSMFVKDLPADDPVTTAPAKPKKRSKPTKPKKKTTAKPKKERTITKPRKKRTVTGEIVQFILDNGPVSRHEIADHIVDIFPERKHKAVLKLLSSQVPHKINQKGDYTCTSDDEGKTWSLEAN